MTELQQRAALAWQKMTRPKTIFDTITGTESMPFPIALDYVQDVTGDRDDAVLAILAAAASALEVQMPKEMVGLTAEAKAVCSYIRGENFSLAAHSVETIRRRAQDTFDTTHFGPLRRDPKAPSAFLCEEWRSWAVKASNAVAHCRTLIAIVTEEANSLTGEREE